MKTLYTNRIDFFDDEDSEMMAEYFEEMQYEELQWLIERLIEIHGWLIAKGTVGAWNGKHEAGKLIKTFHDFFYVVCGKDYDTITDVIVNDEGNIEVSVSHHDGNNHFEIKQLTKKGMNYMEDKDYDYKSLCKAFSDYTRKKMNI